MPDFFCNSLHGHRIRLFIGSKTTRCVWGISHLEKQLTTLHQLLMSQIELGDLFAIQSHPLYITLLVANSWSLDLQYPAIA